MLFVSILLCMQQIKITVQWEIFASGKNLPILSLAGSGENICAEEFAH